MFCIALPDMFILLQLIIWHNCKVKKVIYSSITVLSHLFPLDIIVLEDLFEK